MKGLLKNIIFTRDSIFFLSHGDDLQMEILKPISASRFNFLVHKYSKKNPYLNTNNFLDFLEVSIKKIPGLEKQMKEEIDHEEKMINGR